MYFINIMLVLITISMICIIINYLQTRNFEFKVVNVGNVPIKIVWTFQIDDEYPARIDKYHPNPVI